MIAEAKKRTETEGLSAHIEYRQGDVIDNPWEDNTFDFIWGEDAWCYVSDRKKLLTEAARVLKPGGTIAFSDWMTGPNGLAAEEAKRINDFMTFPHTDSLAGYQVMLEAAGFNIKVSENLCELFAECTELYLKMMKVQHTYDAMKILGGDQALFDKICEEFQYMLDMARQDKFGRGRIVAELA
jgi:SAM-dependent methyltransferase